MTLMLGCVTTYDAVIISKDGIILGDLPISSVDWERVLDDISEAEVTVPLAGKDCAPCGIVGNTHVWHHELVLYRDGEYVWSGPVIRVRVGRDQATITARDLFALMDRRLLHEEHCFSTLCGTAPADLTVLAKTLIDDAFVVDGHGYQVEIYNQASASLDGGLGERLYQIGEHAWDALSEELGLGLDATVLGKKIIVGAAPFGRAATLTDEDFLVDLEFEEDGLALNTRVITLGDGVVGIATAPGSDVNGEHPYYGLLEHEGNNRQELGTQELADAGAAAIISSSFPAPVTLITPDGAQLSPNAPITINQLVPGVMIPIVATNLCREVSGEYILTKLTVQWSEESGEVVGVTMGTLGSLNSNEGSD